MNFKLGRTPYTNVSVQNMQPTPVTPAQSRTVFEASSPVVERRRTMLDTQVGLARLTTLRKTLNVSKHSDAVAPPGSSPDPFSNSDEIESDLLSNDESNNPEDVSEPNTDSQSTGPSDPSSPLQPYEPISSNITLGIPHNTTSTVVYTQGVSSVGSTPNTSPLSVTSSSSSRIPVRSRGSFSTPTSTSARRAVPNKEITTDSDQQHDGKLSSCSHIDENEFTVPGDNARATVSGSKYPAINRKENSSPASTHTNRGNAPPATSHVMSGGVDKSTNNIEPRVSPGTGPSRRANILKMSPSASMTKANVSPVASAKVQSVRLPLSRTLRQATALSTPTRDSIKQNQKGPAHKASLTIGVPVPGSFVHVQSSSPQGSPSPVTQSHPIVNESLAVPTASTGTKAQFTTWLRSPRHSRQQSQEPKHELVKKSTSLLSRIKGRKSEIRKSLATPPVSTPVQDTSQALMSEADPKPTQPATPQATVSEVNSPARFAATMNSPSFAIRPPTPDSTEGGLADTFSERGVLGGITIAPDTSIPATQELFHTICAYITRHPTNPDSLIFMRLAQILKHAMTRANEVDQATERAKQAALEAKQSAELAELHMQDFHRNSTGLVQRIELAFRAQREANEDVSQDDSDKEN